MKKIIFCVAVALALTRAAFSGEYREFTNQDEKSIHARIVQYDVKGDRVQLELQNRKKAWIQLSDLSKADQAYIQQYSLEQTKEASAKELSKKELRAIGEQYIEVWKSGNIEEVRAFFLQPEDITQSRFDEYKKIIMHFNITKTGDSYIRLEARRRKGERWQDYTFITSNTDERWLLFTANGKIKYDSILLKHPIQIAQDSLFALLSNNSLSDVKLSKQDQAKLASQGYDREIAAKRFYSCLEQTGIPLFGLDLSDNTKEIEISLFRIMQWLQDEGDKWDSSEPKVFFPEEALRV